MVSKLTSPIPNLIFASSSSVPEPSITPTANHVEQIIKIIIEESTWFLSGSNELQPFSDLARTTG